MKAVEIGVVAEGPSDLVVIQRLFGEYFRKHGLPNAELHFKNLQPYIDNTSKSGYSEGGWLMVYKWCISHPPDLRSSTFFQKGIFADDMDEFQVSGIVVHMDADICEELEQIYPEGNTPTTTCPADLRGGYVAEALTSWLWPNGEAKDDRHILCPAVESTEAWLVSGLSDEANPEELKDVQKILAELDYLVVKGKNPPANIKKPNKRVSNYEKITDIASIEIDRVVERCKHFQRVAIEIRELVQVELSG